jgi:hypothetical protein
MTTMRLTKLSKPVMVALAVIMALSLSVLGLGVSHAATSSTSAGPPVTIYGCVVGSSRTLEHVYTNQGNFLASGGCTKLGGFEVTVGANGTVTPPPTPTPTPTQTTPTPTPTPTQTTPSTFSCTETGSVNCGAYADPSEFPNSNGFTTYVENQDVGEVSGTTTLMQTNGLPAKAGQPDYISTDTVPNSGGSVQVFTSIQQLLNNWNATADNWTGSGDDTPISSLKSFTITNSHTDPSGSQYEWAPDIWTSGSFNQDVMLWQDSSSARCAAAQDDDRDIGQMTLDGQPWTVTQNGNAGSEIIIYEDGFSGTASTCAQNTSGTIDVLGAINWLESNDTAETGYPTAAADPGLTMVNTGWEITQAPAGSKFTQNSMKYNVVTTSGATS